jgi:chromosome segregation ATPase
MSFLQKIDELNWFGNEGEHFMTLLQIFFVLSIVGAIAFFGSGYLICFFARKERLALEMAKGRQEMSTALLYVHELESEREKLLADHAAMEKYCQETERLEERLEETDALEQRFEKVETERSQMEVLLASLRIDYKNLNRVHVEDERSRQKLDQEITALRQKMSSSEARLEAERTRLKDTELAYAEAKNHLEKISTRLLDMDFALTNEKAARAKCEEERDAAREMAAQADREKADLAAKLHEAESHVRIANSLDSEVKRLRTDLEASLLTQKTIEEDFAQKLDAAQKGQDALEARFKAATAELERTQSEREKISGEITDLREQLDAAGAKVAALEEARATGSQEPGVTQKEIEELTVSVEIAQAELKDLRVKLQIAQAKLAEVDRLVEENRDLRIENDELQAHREAGVELEQLRGEHKQLRINAELMAQKLEELEGQEAELTELRAKAEEIVSLTTEVAELRVRESALQAKLFSAGRLPTMNLQPRVALDMNTEIGDMKAGVLPVGLDALLRAKNARTAVLADGNGFVIANAGETYAQEGLAAFTGLMGEMTMRARTFLPLGDLVNLKIIDSNAVAISCRFFESAGMSYALATVDTEEPGRDEAEERAVDLVKSYTTKRTYEGDYSGEHVLESASG